MPNNPKNLVQTILAIATVPSWTSHEERLHPLVHDFCAHLPDVQITTIADNNLLLSTAAARNSTAPVPALSAHLDKINHFDDNTVDKISAEIITENSEARLHGLLDDAVGIGICLHLLAWAAQQGRPLRVLLSECEEGVMFRNYPHLLNPKRAKTLSASIGAKRIADYLIKTNQLPSVVIVIDVTPLFRGNAGIALYEKAWERANFIPTDKLITATKNWADKIKQYHPLIKVANNRNDYLTYAESFSEAGHTVPCLAIEPSVDNYHSASEKVYKSDIAKVEEILMAVL